MTSKDLIKSTAANGREVTEGQMILVPPGYTVLSGGPGGGVPPQSHLWDYLGMIWRRRWLVVLIFLLCTGLAVVRNHSAVPLYQASAKLHINPEAPQLVAFQGQELTLTARQGPDFLNTQMQIITGRQLASQVLDRLAQEQSTTATTSNNVAAETSSPEQQAGRLDQVLEVAGLGWAWIEKLLGLAPVSRPLADGGQPLDPPDYGDLMQQMRVRAFLSRLDVRPLRETELIQVSYISADPRQCARVVNTVCEEYINWTYESKYQSYDYARKWLKEKLDEMKARLEQSENELLALTSGGKGLAVSDASADVTLPEQLEALRQKVTDAERVMLERQFELGRYDSEKNFAALTSVGDPDTTRLLDTAAASKVAYDKLRVQLGANSREVRQLQAELDSIAGRVHEAYTRARQQAQFAYDQARANYNYIQKLYEAEQARAGGIKKDQIQYNILKREVDVNRELYNGLLQRWKEVGVAAGIKAGYASVVEPAVTPLVPSFPNKYRTLELGALLGILLGVGLVFFLDYMDTSVKDPEELERLAHLPILGYVARSPLRRLARGEARVSIELLTHFRPHSEFAENIRAIRTSIQYGRTGHAPQTIMVTSCLPGEGKTTVATNLAIALASLNKRVLLIDADLKRPSLSRLFNFSRRMGLTEILTGKFDGGNLPETEIKNLSVVASGARSANPVELLDSEAMRRFLKRAQREYDHIIIDAAPAFSLADALVLAPHVDGVVLVVRPGKTPREAVRRVRERLVDVHGNVLGLVVNNPTNQAGQRYQSRYSYSYHYRDGYGLHRSPGDGFEDGGSEDLVGSGREVVEIAVASRRIGGSEASGNGGRPG